MFHHFLCVSFLQRRNGEDVKVLQQPAPQPEDKQLILRVGTETLPGLRNCTLGQTRVGPHPESRSCSFPLPRHNLRGEKKYRNHSKAHSFSCRLASYFSHSFCKPLRGKAQVIKSISSLHIILSLNLVKKKNPPISARLKTPKSDFCFFLQE